MNKERKKGLGIDDLLKMSFESILRQRQDNDQHYLRREKTEPYFTMTI